MSANRQVKKVIALTLTATALAVTTQIGAQPASARTGAAWICTTTQEQGYPNAVPPILPPPLCSELPAIRRAEAMEAQELSYRLPATARYSNAEMNAYASEG